MREVLLQEGRAPVSGGMQAVISDLLGDWLRKSRLEHWIGAKLGSVRSPGTISIIIPYELMN